MISRSARFLWSAFVAASVVSAAGAADKPDFQRQIRPILSEKCYACHGPDEAKVKSGLRLDVADSPFKELKSGKRAIVAGKPARSELIKRIVTTDEDDVMPPKKTGKVVTKEEAELLRKWIAGGAEFKGHWSFTAPVEAPLPKVKNARWSKHPVDRFVLAQMGSKGLAPEAEADKHTLLRRASLDLTGLPPTPDEVEAFLADTSPGAYEKLVDRLLDTPAYGERMAQWWLDLARYADTNGYHIDTHRDMWLWREWVIGAFNKNTPFDRFTVEQLAGDLLPGATVEQRVASGFNRNTMVNFEGGADPDEYQTKYVVDRVNTTAVTFLGLTVGCAECHDHKYDPISTKEFYQFYAFFNSITEKGLDGEKLNPIPSLRVPTPQMQAEVDQRKAEAEKLAQEHEKRLVTPTAVEAEKLATWEKSVRGALREGWQALAPSETKSSGGSTLKTLPGRTILVSGANPAKDVYDLEMLPTEGRDLRALRIEVLPHEAMANQAFARSFNGNFVITGVEAVAEAADPSSEPRAATPELSVWRAIGPFKGNDQNDAFNRAFINETDVDLAKTYDDGKLKWTEKPDWKDREVTSLSGDNAATYLFRTITVPQAQIMHLSLGSDDGLRVWLNGQQVLANNASRAVAPDQEDVQLSLHAGENKLLMKVVNGGGGYGFYFDLKTEPVLSYPVKFTVAAADMSQKDFSAAGLIDDKADTGWSIAGDKPENRVEHQVVLVAKQPFGFATGTRLRVKLRSESKFAGHAPGHFRLSVSSAPALAELGALSVPLQEALARPEDKVTPDDRTALTRFFVADRSPDAKASAKRVADAKGLLDKAEKAVPETMVMAEMEKPRDTFQLIRGDWQHKGEKVLPGTPRSLPPLKQADPARATRLDLAKWFTDPEHPLMARVMVNRFWQLVFGTGIVKTANDLGNQGDLPSHPELLDWLAHGFSHGIPAPDGTRGKAWDVKAMMRLLVTSSAYRQSSVVAAAKLEKDPYNRLLARGPRFRLDAEFLRDQALAVGGLLDRRVGGPSVKPYQPAGLWEAIGFGAGFSSQSYEPSKGDDLYRRGLYVYWKRSLPHPAMTTFDAPNREVCTVSRPRTSTPLQALVLLNDPQYVEAARGLAQRVLREAKGDLRSQLEHAFRITLARPPRAEELELMERLYRQQLANYTANREAAERLVSVGDSPRPADVEPSVLAAWTALGNILLNLDEVVTKG
ncbi:MAG: PSD1 and planctomycete cytochrome C domain-containing protein [Verrucomicrobiota bacterium]